MAVLYECLNVVVEGAVTYCEIPSNTLLELSASDVSTLASAVWGFFVVCFVVRVIIRQFEASVFKGGR